MNRFFFVYLIGSLCLLTACTAAPVTTSDVTVVEIIVTETFAAPTDTVLAPTQTFTATIAPSEIPTQTATEVPTLLTTTVIPSETPTEDPIPTTNAANADSANTASEPTLTVDVHMDISADTLTVGDEFEVTVDLSQSGTCRYLIYDLTLETDVDSSAAVSFITPPEPVTQPRSEPQTYVLRADTAGTLQITPKYYGESDCETEDGQRLHHWMRADGDAQVIEVAPNQDTAASATEVNTPTSADNPEPNNVSLNVSVDAQSIQIGDNVDLSVSRILPAGCTDDTTYTLQLNTLSENSVSFNYIDPQSQFLSADSGTETYRMQATSAGTLMLSVEYSARVTCGAESEYVITTSPIESIEVTAHPNPENSALSINSFTVSNTIAERGEALTLQWDTTDAIQVNISNIQEEIRQPLDSVGDLVTIPTGAQDNGNGEIVYTLTIADVYGNAMSESITLPLMCKYPWFFSSPPVIDHCARDAITNSDLSLQQFENGYMLWAQDSGLIVVLFGGGGYHYSGDTWQAGEPVSDPEIVPPAGLLQPEYGFGKLWREFEWIRNNLGWAVAPETRYYGSYQWTLCPEAPVTRSCDSLYVSWPDGRTVFVPSIRLSAGPWQLLE